MQHVALKTKAEYPLSNINQWHWEFKLCVVHFHVSHCQKTLNACCPPHQHSCRNPLLVLRRSDGESSKTVPAWSPSLSPCNTPCQRNICSGKSGSRQSATSFLFLSLHRMQGNWQNGKRKGTECYIKRLERRDKRQAPQTHKKKTDLIFQ